MFLSCQNIGVDTLKKWDIKLEHHFLLAIIWSFQNKENTCFISLDTIADYMNESERKIDRLIKDLKNKHFIFCNGKEKALTEKGSRYCKEVFCFPTPKSNNNKTVSRSVPKWYGDYRRDVDKPQEQATVNLEEAKEAVKWLEKNNYCS